MLTPLTRKLEVREWIRVVVVVLSSACGAFFVHFIFVPIGSFVRTKLDAANRIT